MVVGQYFYSRAFLWFLTLYFSLQYIMHVDHCFLTSICTCLGMDVMEDIVMMYDVAFGQNQQARKRIYIYTHTQVFQFLSSRFTSRNLSNMPNFCESLTTAITAEYIIYICTHRHWSEKADANTMWIKEIFRYCLWFIFC